MTNPASPRSGRGRGPVGYEAATRIAKEALATGRGVAELVPDKGLLPAGTLAELLRPEAVAGPGQALV